MAHKCCSVPSFQLPVTRRSVTREARRTELAALESTRVAQARMKEEVDELMRM